MNIGDKVILGRHQSVGGFANWFFLMDQFVGQEAIITKFVCCDPKGFDLYKVDVDGGLWNWREVNMIPCNESISITSVKSDGCFCSKCGNFFQYVEPTNNFVCFGCKH